MDAEALISRYRPQGEAEIRDTERVRALLRAADDPWLRSLPLHLTGSALVVHPDNGRVLLRWHQRQQAWLQVGGHGDPGESDPLAIALREAREETGLADLAPWPDGQLRHLVIVGVPAAGAEPAHEHADLRFVLATRAPGTAQAENPDAPLRWLRGGRRGRRHVRAQPAGDPVPGAAPAGTLTPRESRGHVWGGNVEVPAMLRRSVEEFGARVSQIRDDQWEAGTPDTEWNVRDLVNHVLAENLWAPPLLAGSTIGDVGDRFDGDVLGPDPKGSWLAASGDALAAADAPGAMDRTVHLSFGDFPGREYAMQLFADHLIHAWDLARAIGADERLDPELVDACTAWFAPMEEAYRSAGAIAARPPVPDGADAQTRLLAMFGRRA